MKRSKAPSVNKRNPFAKALALKQYQPKQTPTKRELMEKLYSKHSAKEQA